MNSDERITATIIIVLGVFLGVCAGATSQWALGLLSG